VTRLSVKAHGPLYSALLTGYALGPDHPMKIRFVGWARRLSGYARLQVPYGSRSRITLDERDLLQREIWTKGSYEKEMFDALFASARGEEVLWDVGAHIGCFTLLALERADVKAVHCFEPDPVTTAALEHNLSLNQGNVRLHALALGASSGTAGFFRGPDANTGLSSLRPADGCRRFEVKIETADRMVFELGVEPPTLMKIDVEGGEADLFGGARRLLREKPPKAIAFETDCDRDGRILSPDAVRPLEEAGYRVKRILRPSGIVDTKENYLAVRRDVV